jgi:hypothetical protein
VSKHCCEMMRSNVENTCEQHPDRHDCPDCLIEYHPEAGEYGLIVHDGGQSMIRLDYCPWCGVSLAKPSPLQGRGLGEGNA